MNGRLAAFAGAVLVAALCPALLLRDRSPPVLRDWPIVTPITLSAPGSLNEALARGLFGGGAGAAEAVDDAAAAPDGPQVVGIVGRLPDRAIVLVRRTGGGNRALSLGDTIDGWRLTSIAADAVLFARGDERRRIDVPAGDR